MEGGFEQIFFDGTLRRADEEGITRVCFRVEVELTAGAKSYAIKHIRVSSVFPLFEKAKPRPF
jgi:hypothetical protein